MSCARTTSFHGEKSDNSALGEEATKTIKEYAQVPSFLLDRVFTDS